MSYHVHGNRILTNEEHNAEVRGSAAFLAMLVAGWYTHAAVDHLPKVVDFLLTCGAALAAAAVTFLLFEILVMVIGLGILVVVLLAVWGAL